MKATQAQTFLYAVSICNIGTTLDLCGARLILVQVSRITWWGMLSPHPRTLAWHPYISCPCLQLSSLSISVTVVPVYGDGSVSRIASRLPLPDTKRNNAWVRAVEEKLEESLLLPLSYHLDRALRFPQYLSFPQCERPCFPLVQNEAAQYVALVDDISKLREMLTHFLALRPSKKLDHFYSRWPFFTIFCLLPPPLQFRLSQIILYIFQLSKCGPSNFLLQLSAYFQ
jgi:hypothetical protein